MFARYYFNNPTHVTLLQSSKASCLDIVSLEAHSQVAAAAFGLFLSPGNDGVQELRRSEHFTRAFHRKKKRAWHFQKKWFLDELECDLLKVC
jgi:hypothetical protein